MVMRLILGLLLILTLLAGCGEDTAVDPAGESSPSGSSSSTPSSTSSSAPSNGPVDFTEVAVVTQTNVGGEVDEQAVDLTDEAAFSAFTAQFEDSRMEDELRTAVAGADVAEGQTVVGAVVAVGCLPPAKVSVELTDAGLMVTGVPDKREATIDCFAAVTSVAVVAVDASLL
jgi:hypothetical protein